MSKETKESSWLRKHHSGTNDLAGHCVSQSNRETRMRVSSDFRHTHIFFFLLFLLFRCVVPRVVVCCGWCPLRGCLTCGLLFARYFPSLSSVMLSSRASLGIYSFVNESHLYFTNCVVYFWTHSFLRLRFALGVLLHALVQFSMSARIH